MVYPEKYSTNIQLNIRRIFDGTFDEYFSDLNVRLQKLYKFRKLNLNGYAVIWLCGF